MQTIQFLSSQPWVERLGWTLVHFLWQGLLISIVYALARRCPARARYILACVTLVAMTAAPIVTWFLPRSAVPDSVTVNLAVRPTSFPSNPIAIPAIFHGPLPSVWPQQIFPWVVAIWLVGAITFWVRLIGGWAVAMRLRSSRARPAPPEWQQTLDRLKARVGVSRPVRLLVSSLVQVPTVIGWFRPVVLTPIGALAGLPADHIEALLLHELAHIRRHDYLVNILQSVVEALLFYHPAVWWVSGHIRMERELCCDDVAVSISGDVFTYASALAELESCRPAHLNVAVAANGGSLADRIGRLLGQSRPASPIFSGPGVILSAILLAATAYALLGQPTPLPKFEVASIKPNTVSDRRGMMVAPQPGGRFVAENAPLQLLIVNAYALPPSQILGGPNWINSDRYDIEARAESAATRERIWLMVQALLEDRFKLKAHREKKELPVYALAAARNGPKLQQSKEGNCLALDPNLPPPPPAPGQSPPCGRIVVKMNMSGVEMQGEKVPMAELTRILTMMMGHPVIDRTGLSETFDVHLKFIPDQALAGLPRPIQPLDATPTADPADPTIFAALQEQLGLRLDSTKAPVEVLVIDHAEKPSAN